jgi:hypothetical protein
MFDLVCCMYVEETSLWNSILQPLVKSWFLACWLRCKIEPPAKLASVAGNNFYNAKF